MGIEVNDSTYITTSYNTESISDSSSNDLQKRVENKNKIKQEYYQFFEYNNKDAWGENVDLFEKCSEIAKKHDYHSADGNITPDGYLSKKEYNDFITALTHNNIDAEGFTKVIISDEENQIIKDDCIFPDSIEDSEAITKKERKRLRLLNGIATTGCITGLIGAITTALAGACSRQTATESGLILKKMFGRRVAKGVLGMLTGGALITAIAGLSIATLTLIGCNIYKNKLVNKATEYNMQNTEQECFEQVNNEQESEGV